MRIFYQMELIPITNFSDKFCKIIFSKIPELEEKINEEGVMLQSIIFEWIVTMYSNIFPIELTLKIWDAILYQGEYYVIKIALAIL